MKHYEGLESLTTPIAHATVAIGAFDGIHLGHQAIIGRAVEDAQAHGRPALVFTFDRHPQELLRPEAAPDYLTTPAQRNHLIAQQGVSALVVARFDLALAQLSPESFVQDILKARLGAEAIVVGTNFFFGRGRAGSAAWLQARQAEFGFRLHALEPITYAGEPVSSTRIREALRAGEIATAEQLLGHPYWLAGTVVSGQRLGRTLGYPTANLSLSVRQVVPLDGIYAVWATLADGRVVGGACSIGNRPTIEGAGRSIETYLLDFDEDIYGQAMELRFVRRLRGEQKFESLDALKDQIRQDVILTRQILQQTA